MTNQLMSAEALYELDDCLTLALDISEKDDPSEYTDEERERLLYLVAAKRYTSVLIGGAA